MFSLTTEVLITALITLTPCSISSHRNVLPSPVCHPLFIVVIINSQIFSFRVCYVYESCGHVYPMASVQRRLTLARHSRQMMSIQPDQQVLKPLGISIGLWIEHSFPSRSRATARAVNLVPCILRIVRERAASRLASNCESLQPSLNATLLTIIIVCSRQHPQQYCEYPPLMVELGHTDII